MASNPGFVTLRDLVAVHQRILARQNVLQMVVIIVAALGLAVAALGAGLALKVDRNAHQINRAKEAVAVFCEQTNAYNAEARQAFIDKFGAQTPPEQQQQLADFVDVLFPQRDCSIPPEATSAPTVFSLP